MWRALLTFGILSVGAIYLACKPNDPSVEPQQESTMAAVAPAGHNGAGPPDSQIDSAQKESPCGYMSAESMTVLVAFLTLLVVVYQANEMRKATEAMKDSTRVARDSTEKELRAYLCVSEARVKSYTGDQREALVQITNCGQTPAYKVSYEIGLWRGPYPHPVDTPIPTAAEVVSNATAVLGPGRGLTLTHKETALAPNATSAIHVHGTVKYQDIFGKESRHTNFRLTWGGPNGRTMVQDGETFGVLLTEPDGNEAN